jgi:hypothetical protein
MSKPRVIILAVAVVAVLGGLIWWAVAKRPPAVPVPVYAGHPLSYWLTPQAFAGVGGANRFKLVSSSLDSNAVAYLVQELRFHHDGTLQTAYDRFWPLLPAWLKLCVPDPTAETYARNQCCIYLGRLGAAGRPAVPELIRLLRKDEYEAVRLCAAYALGQIASRDDSSVIEALAAASKDKDAQVKSFAARALKNIAQGAAKAGLTNAPPGTPPTNPVGAAR